MITCEFPPNAGGVGYYVSNLSRKLVERKNEVTVITRKRNSNENAQEFVEGICVRRVPYYPIYPFHASLLTLFISRLLKSLESEFDMVHIHSPWPLPVRTSLPIMTTVHTPMRVDARHHEIFDLKSLFEKMQSATVYPPMESELFTISRKITVVSQTVALELEEYGFNSPEIRVVKNGVDSRSFFPCKSKDDNEEYVLYAGVLRARKGLFDLVQSASDVCKIRPNTKFIICGAGPFRKRMERAVKKMGLTRQFVFLGYVSRDKLIHTFQNATVQVIPSHYEGLPTVLLEGMACGLPVVATDIGGNNEVINSGVNGFLVPPKSPNALAEAILRLLNDPWLRENLGIAARNTVLMNYTWDKVTDIMTECYESII